MKAREMWREAKKATEELREEWEYIGLRFENKEREVGDICEDSKHNPARDDERDFPEYGTPEYDELPDLEGVSCWDAEVAKYLEVEWHKYSQYQLDKDAREVYNGLHAYIVVGNMTRTHDDCDDNEIVIVDGMVDRRIY